MTTLQHESRQKMCQEGVIDVKRLAGHIAAECGSTASAEQKQTKVTGGQITAVNQGRVHSQPRCYRCNKLGHISTRCPENKGS